MAAKIYKPYCEMSLRAIMARRATSRARVAARQARVSLWLEETGLDPLHGTAPLAVAAAVGVSEQTARRDLVAMYGPRLIRPKRGPYKIKKEAKEDGPEKLA